MNNRTVLVVDDEADLREVVQMSLEMTAGWGVLTASSGSDALAKAVTHQPDLVLLDVMMPGMDGPETFTRLQSDPATAAIPVVFLTAKVQRTEVLDLHQLGALGLIAKPFNPTALASQIDEMLGTV